MRIVPLIACTGLLTLGGCQKAEPFPAGDKTPVNATPTPEVSATGAAAPAAAPSTPPPSLVPSPVPPALVPRPGG